MSCHGHRLRPEAGSVKEATGWIFVRGLFQGAGILQIPIILALLLLYVLVVILRGFFRGLAGR